MVGAYSLSACMRKHEASDAAGSIIHTYSRNKIHFSGATYLNKDTSGSLTGLNSSTSYLVQ